MGTLLHPGAVLISPYQQGRLDSLCGLYALINATRVLHALHKPLSVRKCGDLFAAGIDALIAKPSSRNAAHHGMTVARQRKLANVLLATVPLRDRPSLMVRSPLPHISKVEKLDHALGEAIAAGDVLLACFSGRISHHSVIVGLSTSRIMLFDSDGIQFVKKSSLRFSGRKGGALALRSLMPIGFD
jgi:hypothetical protein